MKWNSKKILLMICVGLAGGALFSFNKGDDRNFQIAKTWISSMRYSRNWICFMLILLILRK